MFDKLPNEVSELLVSSHMEIDPAQVIHLHKTGVNIEVFEPDGYSYPYNPAVQVSSDLTYAAPLNTEFSLDVQPDGTYIVTMVSTQVIHACSKQDAIDQFNFEIRNFTSTIISPED